MLAHRMWIEKLVSNYIPCLLLATKALLSFIMFLIHIQVVTSNQDVLLFYHQARTFVREMLCNSCIGA